MAFLDIERIINQKNVDSRFKLVHLAALRARECVMKTVTAIQENAEDIYAEAVQSNEERAAEEAAFEDESDEERVFEEVSGSDLGPETAAE